MTEAHETRSVLLINMGGPRNLAEVRPYLRRIFSDPYVIQGGTLKRWLLSRFIAGAAARKSRARYALIGGRSSAVEDMERLARQLTDHFAARGTAVECAVATRYSTPSIEDALASFQLPDSCSSRCPSRPESVASERDADRHKTVTPVYLFPHETSVMTGSCADALERAAAKPGIAVEAGVRHLGATEAYARGWSEAIKQAVRSPSDTFVLLSCHSLPRSLVERGDPYVREVERSVELIQARLGELAGGLAYQSQTGENWLGPTVEQTAADAYAQGHRELIVAPLSFVAESVETLVDLDRELREAAFAIGFRRFERLSTPDKLGFLRPMVVECLCKEWGLEC